MQASVTAVHSYTATHPAGEVTLIMVALSLAIFLVSLDAIVITTALPTIAKDFRLSNSAHAWVCSAYLLTNAASIPLWGRLSEIFGRKAILLFANMIFMAGSIASALSPTGATLIAGRAVQGVGGGGIGALVNIVIGDMRYRGLLYGTIAAVWAVSCSMGPLIGAGFAQNIGWRWIFWINLPIQFVSVIPILLFLHMQSERTPLWAGLKSIDWLGSASITTATVLFLLGLQLGGVTYPWRSAIVVCFITFGLMLFGIFFFIQLKVSQAPIMPLRTYSHSTIICALIVTFFDAFVFNSISFFVPQYYQSVIGVSPLRSGVLILPIALPLCVVSIASGWVMERIGGYTDMLRAGLLLMTISTGLLISLPAYLDLTKMTFFLVLLGIGFGPNFQAPLLAIQAKLRSEDMASGTATFGFVRMLSGAVGIVLCQVVYQTDQSWIAVDNEENSVGNVLDRTRAIRQIWILLCVASFLGLLASVGIERPILQTLTSTRIEARSASTTQRHQIENIEMV